MSKDIRELVQEMRANSAGVRFAVACKVATHYFGEPRQVGSSHRVWKMPWAGDPRVNMQDAGGKAKAYQVEQLLRAIDRAELRKAEPTATAQEPESSKAKRSNRGRKAKRR